MTTPSDSALPAAHASDKAAPWPAYVTASVACHAGAGLLAVAAPASWPWAVAAIAVNHAVLTAGGLWPRSRWLGSNWTCLPAHAAARREIAITIDDGPDPAVTPAVLDLLDAHGAKATFFCIGTAARAHPALAREIVRRGHSVQNHSDRHSTRFSLLGPKGMAREIAAAQASLADITGEAPRYFRAPAGLRNPFLDPVLAHANLTLASWTRRGFDTMTADPDVVLARLTRGLRGGDILLLHDGHAARTRDGTPVILAVLPRLLAQLEQARLTPVTLRAALAPARPA